MVVEPPGQTFTGLEEAAVGAAELNITLTNIEEGVPLPDPFVGVTVITPPINPAVNVITFVRLVPVHPVGPVQLYVIPAE